jgi:hypothetical protein
MTTRVSLEVLDDLRVASPCPMDWDRMVGDEKRRFCEHCGLHVHNTTAMTQQEVLALVAEAGRGGRVCARLYKRADGTLLTRDCPVGLRAARARLRRVCGRVAAGLSLLLSGAWVFGRGQEGGDTRLSAVQPFATLRDWLNPLSPLPPAPRFQSIVMGSLCGPLPPSAPVLERTKDDESLPKSTEEIQQKVAELERARLAEESGRER